MMSTPSRLSYYRRIFAAYLTQRKSQLTFWHEVPEVNENFRLEQLGEYYMTFAAKADYPGEYDDSGIPLLNYHGTIGLQYNPIAIAQYGLGNYNLFCGSGAVERRQRFLNVADWLARNLEMNPSGLWVWNHHFDWEYRTTLRAPWYSALAQGQGISVLVRAFKETSDDVYLAAARRAFQPFLKTVDEGGVAFIDEAGHTWFEEYIVDPPTHILNGFLWAIWGVYDYYLATSEALAQQMFERAVQTVAANLEHYDVGFWSLYEQSGTWLKMLASPFYHRLHIVQLDVLYRLTGEDIFLHYSNRWQQHLKSPWKRNIALIYKSIFKILYY